MGSEVKKGVKYSTVELMVSLAAKQIRNGDRVILGQGIPIAAGVLAKMTHAPGCVLMTEGGIVDFEPYKSPFHIAESTTMKGFSYACDLADVFTTILFRGYVDLCCLGAAQVDRYGNINSTVVGDYENPRLRLPGAGGAADFIAHARRTVITLRGGEFVEKLDYCSSPGYLDGGDTREKAGFPPGSGPSLLISSQGVFGFDKKTKELYLKGCFPGVEVDDIKANIPWDLKIARRLERVEPPPEEHLRIIREFARDLILRKGEDRGQLVDSFVKFIMGKQLKKKK
ncbi:MAG: CoA-transferase subunit beta [Candidatus Freyarchaeota archaeon]